MAIFGKKTQDKEKDDNQIEPKLSVPGKKVVKKTVKKDDTGSEGESMKDLYGSTPVKVAGKEVKEKRVYRNAYKILEKPVITEKATALVSENKYVFAVSPKANKIEIAKAIEEVYGIRPLDINIVKMMGKKVVRGRYTGKRKDWKKAIVTLPKGKSIEIYEGV